MGVHLIEVCSGSDSSTESGRYSIFSKLLEARKQNIDRLKHTIPGMKKSLHPSLRDDGLKIIKPCCCCNKAFYLYRREDYFMILMGEQPEEESHVSSLVGEDYFMILFV